jgi:monothiol glutaredoxin
MPRSILDASRLHPAIRATVEGHYADTVTAAVAAVERHPVVVVGMAMNPFVKKARRLLTGAGIAHEYLEYGSYFNEWRRRTALKMWTGWPTLPMVFVRGTLIGGANDLERLLASGELARLLADASPAAAVV